MSVVSGGYFEDRGRKVGGWSLWLASIRRTVSGCQRSPRLGRMPSASSTAADSTVSAGCERPSPIGGECVDQLPQREHRAIPAGRLGGL